MKLITFKIDLTLRAPILTQAVGGIQFGYDSAALKYEGKPVLKGSLIKGNLRHTLQYFARLTEGEEGGLSQQQIAHWFGAASASQSSQAPQRGSLDISYFFTLSSPTEPQDAKRHRIRINPETGTVAKGALQVMETCFETGEEVTFSGTLSGWMDSEEQAELQRWLEKAFTFITALGSNKSTGFGSLIRNQISCQEIEAAPPEIPHSRRFGIKLWPDRPFCIAKPHMANSNRFEAKEHIPGNVIKAAMINALRLQPRDGRPDAEQSQLQAMGFDHWRITHAKPAPAKQPTRRTELPLSLVLAAGKFANVALLKEPALINKQAPAFQPDWKEKDWESANDKRLRQAGKPGFSRLLEVRTQVNDLTTADKAGQAAEGQLFSLETIDPGSACWCADIDLSALDQQQFEAARKALAQMLAYPLPAVGKTKANLNVDICPQPFTPESQLSSPPQLSRETPLVVQLESEARLLPARMVDMPLSNGNQQLQKRYADYWHRASGGLLQLSHFFAQQHKEGGHFYHRYYRQGERNYRPEWLTEPGSVFVLEICTEDALAVQKLLEQWLRLGLPQAADRDDSDWRDNLWLRENGFGEILICDLKDLYQPGKAK